MAGPGDFIRRAERNRRTAEPFNRERIPAPIPMGDAHSPAQTENGHTAAHDSGEKSGEGEMRPVPRNVGGHALYRELMRSHDRMGTRHIGR